MSKTIPYIGEVDFSKMHFGPHVTADKGSRVEVFADDTSMRNSNKPKFRLTKNETEPIVAPFGLDKVNDDGDALRRGLAVTITDPDAIKGILAFEAKVNEMAKAKSQEWFKKPSISDVELGLRFNSCILDQWSDENKKIIKIKVKCTGSKVPTAIFRYLDNEDGNVMQTTEQDIANQNTQILVLSISLYAIYFIGKDGKFGCTFQAEKMVVKPGEAPDPLADMGMTRPFKVLKTAPSNEPADGPPSEDAGAEPPSGEGGLKVELLDEAESAM